MALNAIKTTAGYVVEGTDNVGKPVELFFDNVETAGYEALVAIEENHLKTEQYTAAKAALPDPERDLYLTFFGKDDEPTDAALHTTLVEVREARDGISLDWSGNPVTVALRLITKGEGDRLRLIAGRLVDMGPTQPAAGGSSPAASVPAGDAIVGAGDPPVVGQQFRS